mgnify:CR=1 FL=1
MTEVNSMYRAQTRSDDLKAQIEKLEGLAHHTAVNPTFERFDAETEDILMKIYGENHKYVESAQEPQTRDIPKKGLQQRRQVLQSILTDLQGLEVQEAELLTGEDREDPPGPS